MRPYNHILMTIFALSVLIFGIDQPVMAEVPNASQFVNLYGSSTNGQITSFSQILPSGQTQAYQIPSGKAIMIQYIYVYFKPTSPAQNLAAFEMQPYISIAMGAYNESSVEGLYTCPFAVSNNNNLKARIIDKTTNNVIPGKIEVTLIGCILPLTGGYVDYYDLLLSHKPRTFGPLPNNLFAKLVYDRGPLNLR